MYNTKKSRLYNINIHTQTQALTDTSIMAVYEESYRQNERNVKCLRILLIIR